METHVSKAIIRINAFSIFHTFHKMYMILRLFPAIIPANGNMLEIHLVCKWSCINLHFHFWIQNANKRAQIASMFGSPSVSVLDYGIHFFTVPNCKIEKRNLTLEASPAKQTERKKCQPILW